MNINKHIQVSIEYALHSRGTLTDWIWQYREKEIALVIFYGKEHTFSTLGDLKRAVHDLTTIKIKELRLIHND